MSKSKISASTTTVSYIPVSRRLRSTPAVNRYFRQRTESLRNSPEKQRRALADYAETNALLVEWLKVRDLSEAESLKARDALMLRMMPLLRILAGKVLRETGTRISREDLIQTGYLAMLEELPNFDADKSSLQTFMTFVVRSAMQRQAADFYGPVRIATNATDKTAFFHGRKAMRQVAESAPGILPSEQIKLAALSLDIDPTILEQMLVRLEGDDFPLDSTEFKNYPTWPRQQILVDDLDKIPEVEVSDKHDFHRLSPLLKKAMSHLPRRTAEMVAMRFFGRGDKAVSYQTIARSFNRSKKTIRQSVTAALGEMAILLKDLGVTADDLRDINPVLAGRKSIVNLARLEREPLYA